MRKLIFGGTIVNEGREFKGSIVIDGDRISKIIEGNRAPRSGTYDETIDAAGCFVLPGIIDEHVHFREPGMTDKATIESESRAAACGGVTTYFEMPNTNPQTTTLEALDDKFNRAAADSHVNYRLLLRGHQLEYCSLRQPRQPPHTGHQALHGSLSGQYARRQGRDPEQHLQHLRTPRTAADDPL